uniref:Uncharacterized protein n=1 Tax=Rhizophora mucronata TaxID=61149 RepID=A0A2P2N4B4_RHIMU
MHLQFKVCTLETIQRICITKLNKCCPEFRESGCSTKQNKTVL